MIILIYKEDLNIIVCIVVLYVLLYCFYIILYIYEKPDLSPVVEVLLMLIVK